MAFYQEKDSLENVVNILRDFFATAEFTVFHYDKVRITKFMFRMDHSTQVSRF